MVELIMAEIILRASSIAGCSPVVRSNASYTPYNVGLSGEKVSQRAWMMDNGVFVRLVKKLKRNFARVACTLLNALCVMFALVVV